MILIFSQTRSSDQFIQILPTRLVISLQFTHITNSRSCILLNNKNHSGSQKLLLTREVDNYSRQFINTKIYERESLKHDNFHATRPSLF